MEEIAYNWIYEKNNESISGKVTPLGSYFVAVFDGFSNYDWQEKITGESFKISSPVAVDYIHKFMCSSLRTSYLSPHIVYSSEKAYVVLFKSPSPFYLFKHSCDLVNKISEFGKKHNENYDRGRCHFYNFTDVEDVIKMFRYHYHNNKLSSSGKSYLDNVPELKYGILSFASYKTYKTFNPHTDEFETYGDWHFDRYEDITNEEALDDKLRKVIEKDNKYLAIHKD